VRTQILLTYLLTYAALSQAASRHLQRISVSPSVRLSVHHVRVLGMSEFGFILLKYSVEYRIDYSSTRPIPEIAIKNTVVQNIRKPDSSF